MLVECRELQDREYYKTDISSHVHVLLARGKLFLHYLIEILNVLFKAFHLKGMIELVVIL